MKGALADFVSNAVQSAISKIGELVSYLGELPEATREFRNDMATLTTSFDEANFSSAQAKDTWTELYAVIGEDDRAVETANNIAKISKNQQELNDWVTITTGIWGTYQDSLPVEGLAEASNETAKTGKVTGVFADTLNWSSEALQMFSQYLGGDVVTAEDAFNVALSECNSEQERQQLITDTLMRLYGGAAETYRDTAGAMMEANRASADELATEAELAETIEPLTTAYTGLKVELLRSFAPAIETVCGGLTNMVTWMKEHPAVAKAIVIALGVVTGAIIAMTVAQFAYNAAALANPVTWIILAIIAAIAILIVCIVEIVKHWDTVKEAFSNFGAWIKEKGTAIKTWFTNLVSTVVNWFTTKITNLKNAVLKPFYAIRDGIKGVFDHIKSFFKLPSIQVTGGFSLNPLSVPKFSIRWNAQGAVLTRPTIFGMLGNTFLGGGEAGPEAVAPIDVLQSYVTSAVTRAGGGVSDGEVLNAIKERAEAIFRELKDGNEKRMNDIVDALVNGTDREFDDRSFERYVRKFV